jgi:hypothetical protein
MSADAPISLPGSRVLLGWWQELSPRRPRRLWYAHTLIHRLEALVEVTGSSALEQFHLALLGVLAAAPPESAADLAERLHLPADVLTLLVNRLEQEGLVVPGVLRPTDAGRQALARGDAAVPRPERRSFAFLDGPEPAFIALDPEACRPLTPPAGWRFDLAALEAAIARPAEWKMQHGFPADVVRLLRPPAEPTAMDSPRVPVDRAEQALLVLAEVDGGRVLAFPTRADAWPLGPEPVWSLPGAEALDELATFDAAAWRAAWQLWARHRSLPGAEVDACRLEVAGHRLRVHAPARLIDRLRQGRSESLEGNAWLLAGSGRIRAAACLELVAG